jgi:hypothetical protein
MAKPHRNEKAHVGHRNEKAQPGPEKIGENNPETKTIQKQTDTHTNSPSIAK